MISLVPQPSCCWKCVGGTKGFKRAFLSLTAIFSAKNGPKLKNLRFFKSAVREFSEYGFGSKKKLTSEAARPRNSASSNLGRFLLQSGEV